MDRGPGGHKGARDGSNRLPPGVEEDRGAGSASIPAWESSQHAGYVGDERVFVGASSDSQRPTALVHQPAIARLDSKHALAPAYTSIEGALGQAGAAQVLQQAATAAQLPAASPAAADADDREQFPAQAMDNAAIAASNPGVLTTTSQAEGHGSREVYNSATLMQPAQAEHDLPAVSAAAREIEYMRAASSAAALELAEHLEPPELSAVYGSDQKTVALPDSSAALLAPAVDVSSKEGGPAGAKRTSALSAPSKAQLKRARKAAAMQRSAQGMPQAGVQKRAWRDWLARRSGEASALHITASTDGIWPSCEPFMSSKMPEVHSVMGAQIRLAVGMPRGMPEVMGSLHGLNHSWALAMDLLRSYETVQSSRECCVHADEQG